MKKGHICEKCSPVWCSYCDEPHDENNCSVALVKEVRERNWWDDYD